MIGRHLAEKYRAGGRTDLGALLARVGESEGLSEALTAVIEGRHTLSEADAAALCEDLATALGSLEELTGGGRRTPRVETL